MTEIRKTKRSRAVALTTLTAVGTVTLQGCDDAPLAEAQLYQSVAECVASGIDATECQQAEAQARADYLNDAPRFENRQLCEEGFGAGQCEPLASGGGSFWAPLLGGFLIAQAIDGVDIDIDRRKRKYAPVYRSTVGGGGYYYGGSNYGPMSRTSSGRYGFDQQALNRPVSAPRVQSRADVASRGGFGGRARSSSG